MSTLRRFASIGIVLWVALILVADRGISQTCNPIGVAPSCETSRNEILEAPRGPVDGQNFAFTLSALPTSSADVHVTVNGAEIPQGGQLVVKDRSILFYPPAVPKEGDLIRAMYQTQFVSAVGSDANLVSLIGPLAGVALLRMVENEEVPPRTLQSKALEASAGHEFSDLTPGKAGGRGLSMLAQRLYVVTDNQRLNSSRTARDELRSLIGVEGTGDIVPATPYDDLFDVRKPSRGTVGPKGDKVQTQRVAKLRSLTMLQRALGGQQPK